MAEWFRQECWDHEIEAAFNARLSRARSKAQYLNIQAYTLLPSNSHAAASLARRALDLDEPDQSARAGLYLGTALAVQGDSNGAIAALEEAIQAQKRHPMHRTAAHIDQALLIALTGRIDMYPTALDRLAAGCGEPSDDDQIEVLIARALIGHEMGEQAAGIAEAALAALDADDPTSGVLPSYLSLDLIKERLRKAAGH